MKTPFLFVVTLLSFIYGGNVLAWDNGAIKTTVVSITVLQNGAFYINAADDVCDSGVNKVASVYKGNTPNGVAQTSEGISMMLSIALTAQVTQSRVALYADDSGKQWGCRLGAIKFIP